MYITLFIEKFLGMNIGRLNDDKKIIKNKEIIFKWDREWDKEFVSKCIWKSG